MILDDNFLLLPNFILL